ncbi:MAG: hypothetical protein IPJ88_18835 [Myxococcales bacterium]|nr:MAG: hypothetical protein IPJ88_18835 [Myxococcales bacterium]
MKKNSVLIFGVSIFLVACASTQPRTSTSKATAGKKLLAAKLDVHLMTLQTPEIFGLSGLDLDSASRFWAVAERDRVLLAFKVQEGHAQLTEHKLSLIGVPEGADTESLGWIDSTHFVLGTERHEANRKTDDILLFEVSGDIAKLEEKIDLPYALFNMTANDNQGIEGLCATESYVLAGVENGTSDTTSKRFAPLALYDLKHKSWRTARLMLSTEQGMLSSLACRKNETNGHLEVLAIERYYSISRLLHFEVALDEDARSIIPETLVDLASLSDGDVPNWEGVMWHPAGGVVLLSDNQTSVVSGPVQVMWIKKLETN